MWIVLGLMSCSRAYHHQLFRRIIVFERYKLLLKVKNILYNAIINRILMYLLFIQIVELKFDFKLSHKFGV